MYVYTNNNARFYSLSIWNLYPYHTQMYLGECKYKQQKQQQKKNYYDQELKSDSDSKGETESDSNSNDDTESDNNDNE